MISRALRKAVSPELIGRMTTPMMAKRPPKWPSRVVETWLTTKAGPPSSQGRVEPAGVVIEGHAEGRPDQGDDRLEIIEP